MRAALAAAILSVASAGPGAGAALQLPRQGTSPQATKPAAQAPTQPAQSAQPPAAPGAGQGSAQAPAADLKGLSRIGLVIEDMGSTAAGCGLKQEALEQDVSRLVTAAGLQVAFNTDEDTYLYVNVNTLTAGGGLCVSRYDVTIFTHATAKLAHTAGAALLQIPLRHAGGLSAGTGATHGAEVMRAVRQQVERLAAEIRTANQ